jgi:hypothetical protein
VPTALPIIRGDSQALYPFTRVISFDTIVRVFQNGTQQRSVGRFGLNRFELNYTKLSQTQKNTIKAAITSAKGAFDSTLTLTLGGTTYTNLSIDSDEWAATEATTTQYSAPLKVSQSLSQNLSPGTLGTAFPSLANGTMCQLPYTQKKRFQTQTSRMAAGPKYSYAEFAGGLTGFPSDGLMAWELGNEHLTDADLATVTAHFIANYGRFGEFSFTDEDSVTYTKVHYASDELQIRYAGPNDSAARVALEVVN